MKWIDTNKGDEKNKNYRSRFVVREKRGQKGEENDGRKLPAAQLFSATPPTEAIKMLASIMVTKQRSIRGHKPEMRIWDISRAHFYGQEKRKKGSRKRERRKRRERRNMRTRTETTARRNRRDQRKRSH